MALFQTGTGYRDATKALTIKALQERQKQAASQLETAATAQDVNADPLSAVSHVLNTFGAGMQQSRADSREADACAQLSQIMAQIDPTKGASMEQIAAMQQLDPEFANRQYEAAQKARTDAAAQQAQFGQQTSLQEDQQKAASELSAQGATQAITQLGEADKITDQNVLDKNVMDVAEKQRQEEAASKESQRQEAVKTPDAEIQAAYDAGNLGGPPGSPEAIAGRDAALAKAHASSAASTNIYNTEGGKFRAKSDELAATRLDEIVRAGADAKPFLSQLRIVADLGSKVGTGMGAEIVQKLGPYAQLAGLDMDVFSGLDEGQAYKAIVDKLAPNMRVTGAGPSSDFDARQFLSSLPSLGRTPEGNKIINDTFEALGQNKMAAAEIAAKAQREEINPVTGQAYTWQEAEADIRALPDPYLAYKQLQEGGATPPATDTGGGGGGTAPVFDPATDAEGDTGTDDQGNKWVVRGNTWVPQ